MAVNIQKTANFKFVPARVWVCCLLLILTWLAYAPVIGFDFVDFDDQLYVQENPMVQKGLTWQGVKWAFTEATPVTGYWVPLTWLSFLMDYSIHGMNAGGYHTTNLVLHMANVLLLLGLFFRMTGNLWRSFLVAVLFALHPLHVESVAWVTERKDVLSTLFWFLTMGAYIGYVQSPSTARYLKMVVLFVLGLMAKPMLVTLPAILLLMDHWPLRRWGATSCCHKENSGGATAWPIVFEKLPLIAISLIAGIAAFFTQRLGGAIVSMAQIPLDVRISNALVSYTTYLGRLFWPTGLAALYPHPGDLGVFVPAAAFATLGAMTLAVLGVGKKAPYAATGWFWYLIALAPVCGLVVIGPHAVADRYAYIPLIGIYVVVSWALPGPKGRAMATGGPYALMAAVLIAAMILLTRNQVQFWKDSDHLFQRMVAVTDNNYVGYNGLGTALAKMGRYKEAELQYRIAVDLNPDYALGHFNLGLSLMAIGKIKEAREHFERAVQLRGNNAGYHLNLGVALALDGDDETALLHFRKAAAMDKGAVAAYINIANILRKRGDRPGAIKTLNTALKIDPDCEVAKKQLAQLTSAHP